MGNIDALRNWGHAKDYVRMQWTMQQQEQPEDFVIAAGVQYPVRQFIEWTANALGMQLRWGAKASTMLVIGQTVIPAKTGIQRPPNR